MGRGGDGMGDGAAASATGPRKSTDAAFRDSQVKQKPGRGAAVITGEADGPDDSRRRARSDQGRDGRARAASRPIRW